MAEAIAAPAEASGASGSTAGVPSAAASAVAPGAYQGWSAWRQAVNVQLVQDLNQANAIRQATLRVLGGG